MPALVMRRAKWVAAALALALLTVLPAAVRTARPHHPLPCAVERTWVPLGATALRGPATARVTLIVFCDFQSPYCARAAELLREIQRANRGVIRIQYRHRPLPIYGDSQLAAEASVAAAEQGQFWRYHDVLFAHQDALDGASLERYAEDLGLDLQRFRDVEDAGRARRQVDADAILAARLGARGAPVFFVNGRPIRGLPDLPTLQKIVDEEIVVAADLLRSGVAPQEIYQRVAGAPVESRDPGSPAVSEGQEDVSSELGPLPPIPDGVYLVDVGDSPVRGPKDAPVTIVTFSDFQCPYCARLEKTLDQVRARYGDQVRIAWKDAPSVELHEAAMGAHEAARAAGEQGRFWEMHDEIFNHTDALDRAAFERYALALGLDSRRFRDALDRGKFQSVIREETAYGVSLAGPSGTPTIFVNGRMMLGAYPVESFRRVIDEELDRLRATGQDACSSPRSM